MNHKNIKKYLRLFSALWLIAAFSACSKKTTIEPKRMSWNEGWEFSKDTIQQPWGEVSLPHTFHIEPLLVNDQYQGDGYYQKRFTHLPQKGERVALYFEGSMHETTVWLNGNELIHFQGGYTPFTVDLTPHLRSDGKQRLLVKVNNEDHNEIPPGKTLETLDFNFYGGIYRPVHFIVSADVFIPEATNNGYDNRGGVRIHFEDSSAESAKANADVVVQNNSGQETEVWVKYRFFNDKTEIQNTTAKQKIGVNAKVSLPFAFQVDQPKLWHPDSPHLYTLEVELHASSGLLDTYSLKTGIRTIALTNEALIWNGSPLFLNGTNRHQEYPYIGYALSDEAHIRDAVRIKEAGFNFVRLSHYPQSESFMRACDSLGLITMNCISGWQFYGNERFIQNSLREVRSLARRDAHHPNVAFWEVSLNESEMQPEFMEAANRILKEELPYQGIYTAGWMDDEAYDLFIPARQHGKPPYYWSNYKDNKRPLLIAEYGDWEYYAQNAGFNQTAFADLQPQDRSSRQLRGDGEKRLLQQAFNFQEAFNSNLKGRGKSTIGHANWVMFDYNRGYADDLESSGISDIFRIPKFAYYFYQSQKAPSDTYPPMVHIANYWSTTSERKVTLFSNAERVDLYLNDQKISTLYPNRDAFSEALDFPPFTYTFTEMRSGSLRAEAYIGDQKVATHTRRTPEKPEKLHVYADLAGVALAKNHKDYFFVRVEIQDKNQMLCPTSQTKVTMKSLTADAEIIGPKEVTAEAGIATFLIRSKHFKNPLLFEAKAEGFSPTRLELKP